MLLTGNTQSTLCILLISYAYGIIIENTLLVRKDMPVGDSREKRLDLPKLCLYARDIAECKESEMPMKTFPSILGMESEPSGFMIDDEISTSISNSCTAR